MALEVKQVENVNIVLFYGGIEANQPRDQLLEWLNSKELSTELNCNLNARKTIDWPANSGSIVHERISHAINQADLAIALFTPDDRCIYGSPNVIEEFGRWIGKKGPNSMAMIRKECVPVHTNAEGLIYIGYKENLLAESKHKILSFLKHQISLIEKNNQNSNLEAEAIIQKYEKFVGREFIFNKINDFISNNASGYFSIVGHPGSGKTAILANFIKSRSCIYHLINKATGNNTRSSFWRSICLHISREFTLPIINNSHGNLDERACFHELMSELGPQVYKDNPLIIVIDAIGDADMSEHSAGENILLLPDKLPDHVFFILARRPKSHFPLNVHVAQEEIKLFGYKDENDDDARRLISKMLRYKETEFMKDGHLDKDFDLAKFKTKLLEQYGGDFMYLNYAIQSLFLHESLRQSLNSALLNKYYSHWIEMVESEKKEIIYCYKLPILAVLANSKNLLSIQSIQDITGIQERIRIRGILNEWRSFLKLTQIDGLTFYKLYSGNFREHLASLEIIKDAQFDLNMIQKSSYSDE